MTEKLFTRMLSIKKKLPGQEHLSFGINYTIMQFILSQIHQLINSLFVLLINFVKSAKSFSSQIVGFVDVLFMKKKKNFIGGHSCSVDQKKSVPDLLTRNLKNQFQVPRHVLMPNIECALVRAVLLSAVGVWHVCY